MNVSAAIAAVPADEASRVADLGTGAPGAPDGPAARPCVVLDTNIVLDLFIFADPASQPVREALDAGTVDWIATPHMREELRRVLGYAQLQPRMVFHGLTADDVLAAFDRHARRVGDAAKARFTCKDADDQCFIDLAVAHGALLLSKDKAVTSMARRLLTLGVVVRRSF